MITIRDRDNGQLFDVPRDFTLEVKDTSPVFNDLGSKTLSASLPLTPHNSRIIGHSENIEIKKKPRIKIPVIVTDDGYVRAGMLYASSPHLSTRTIAVTIAFNEGIMYEEMGDLSLPDFPNMPVITDFGTSKIDFANRLLTEDGADRDISVFPVRLLDEAYSYESGGNAVETTTTTIVNEIESGLLKQHSYWGIVLDSKLRQVRCPDMFGITPFVRVWKILDLIFENWGYRIGANPFKEHFQLKRLCVLNNTADAMVTDSLRYSQLMPDVTASEFLQSLYCRFGIKVFFDGNRNMVNLRFIKDMFTCEGQPVSASGFTDPDYTNASQLKLAVGRNLDRSAIDTDTYEEFLSKYNNTVDIYKEYDPWGIPGIVHRRKTGLFHQVSTFGNKNKVISSIHFDWDKKDTGLETVEISSVDEAITGSVINGVFLPYYGLKMRMINYSIEIDGNVINYETKNNLAFVYDMGEVYEFAGSTKVYKGFKYGSIFPYIAMSDGIQYQVDRDGNFFTYALTLVGEDGAFNRFFKEYDAFLRHANHVVKFESHIDLHQIASLDHSAPVLVQNQALLIDNASYNIGHNNRGKVSFETRSMKLLEPYDLTKEQYLPVYAPIKYRWTLYNNRDGMIELTRLLFENQYRESDPPKGQTFVSMTVELLEDPNPPSALEFWFMPPTKSDFENNRTIGQTDHLCIIRLLHTYRDTQGHYKSEYVPPERRPQPYKGWYKPTEI